VCDAAQRSKPTDGGRRDPNPKGYTLWAEAMEPMIKKLMGEK